MKYLLFLMLSLLSACSQTVPRSDSGASAKPAAATDDATGTRKIADGNKDMPAGVNMPDCKPAQGRQHIFLIHGTLHSSQLSFGALAPRLAKAGHCLHAVDYGALTPSDALKARKPVSENVREVAQAIDRVLKQTGQSQIDLVGFSQGGLIGFYLLRDGGLGKRVRQFTAIAPSVRGTTSEGALRFNQTGACPACADQFHQSAFMREFTARPFTVEGVRYTVVATRDDWIVTPPESQFVREPGVRNVLVQDRLRGKSISHVGLMYDPEAVELISGLINQ